MLRFKKNTLFSNKKFHNLTLNSEEELSAHFTNVFSTYNKAEIALIKSLFDNEPITYYIQGENLSQLYGAIPVQIMVKNEQVAFAKQLLNKLSEVTINKDSEDN